VITKKTDICPDCGGALKKYDKVKRSVRYQEGQVEHITIQRYKCSNCGHVHRLIPHYVYPNKQYNKQLIDCVSNGYVSNDILGLEDYPCDMTIKRWKHHD